MKAQLWIFAGPNGAGKSTLVAQYIRGRLPVINPDEIGRSLTPKNGLATLVQAGRIAIAQREAKLAAGGSFGIETTFTGHSELDLIPAWAIDAIPIEVREPFSPELGRLS